MSEIKVEDGVWATTSTAGTGAFTVTTLAGQRGFDIFTNGTKISYFRSDSPTNFEDAEGTINTSGGVTTITPTAVIKSSNSGAAVPWGAGSTQNVRCCPTAGTYMNRRNALAEIATDGTGDTACGNIGASTNGVRGLTGGTDGRAVRYASANTATNAKKTDTNDQLAELLFFKGGVYYRKGNMVPGMSGLTSGQIAFLGDDTTPIVWKAVGDALPAGVAPSSSVRCVRIGQAFSTTTFLFDPQAPVGGV